MSLHLWSLIMAIILAFSGNWNNTTTSSNTKQEVIIPEEAIVCEAEAEIDGCGASCAYPKDWEWLEDLHENGFLKKIEIGRGTSITVVIDATVIPVLDEHPIDCFSYVEAIMEDPEGDWFIESQEFDEIGQPVWRVSNSRGWKANLVFAELDTD